MKKTGIFGVLIMVLGYAFSTAHAIDKANQDDAPAIKFGAADEGAVNWSSAQDKPVTKPTPKSKLKKPRIGFQTTVKPEDMKSYHRPESGDVSAQ